MHKIRRILAWGAALALLAGVGAASAATSAAPSNYVAQASVRVLDTRTANTPLAAGKTLVVSTGVPASATAVTVNVTITGVTGGGYVVVYADGSARPNPGSNVNFGVGQTQANQVTVPTTNGKIDITSGTLSGSVQVIVDVEGYYEQTAAAYAPAATLSASDKGGETVSTGGNAYNTALDVADLTFPTAGTYQVSVNAKATPAAATGAVQVFPAFYVYDQPISSTWAGNLFNIGSGALESGANGTIDSYYSGSGLVTVTAGEVLHFYAGGYDSDKSPGSYTLDSLFVVAVPVTVPAS